MEGGSVGTCVALRPQWLQLYDEGEGSLPEADDRLDVESEGKEAGWMVLSFAGMKKVMEEEWQFWGWGGGVFVSEGYTQFCFGHFEWKMSVRNSSGDVKKAFSTR